MKEIRIYFEGTDKLRPGFRQFFTGLEQSLRVRGWRPQLISTGGNPDRDFRIAVRDHREATNILLKDSEGPYKANAASLVCKRAGIAAKHAKDIYFMVELMEAWFLADPEALASYYGDRFTKLKATQDVERVPKAEVLRQLKRATRGAYDKSAKSSQAPRILALINPDLVRQKAANCQKLFDRVRNAAGIT